MDWKATTPPATVTVLLGSATPPESNGTIPAPVPGPEQLELVKDLKVILPVGVTPTPAVIALAWTTSPTAADVMRVWLASCMTVVTVTVARVIAADVLAVVEES